MANTLSTTSFDALKAEEELMRQHPIELPNGVCADWSSDPIWDTGQAELKAYLSFRSKCNLIPVKSTSKDPSRFLVGF